MLIMHNLHHLSNVLRVAVDSHIALFSYRVNTDSSCLHRKVTVVLPSSGNKQQNTAGINTKVKTMYKTTVMVRSNLQSS